jgi:hypothetical protein
MYRMSAENGKTRAPGAMVASSIALTPAVRTARRSCAQTRALQPVRPIPAGLRTADAPCARIARLSAALGTTDAGFVRRSRNARLCARRGAAEADSDEGDAGVLLSRSQLVSKSVITRTSGTNLGLVTQVRARIAPPLRRRPRATGRPP